MVRLLALAASASAMTLAEEPKNRPVSKVIALLEKMEEQLEAEKSADADLNKKMECWCKKTGEEKSDAIESAMNKIASLKADITRKTGMIADLGSEIDGLKKDIESESSSLKQLTQLRKEENEKFTKEETDMVEAIRALEAAITVLKKHQSLLQSGAKVDMQAPLLSVASLLKAQIARNSDAVVALSSEQKKKLEQFVQQPTFNEYASQSGEIFGILGNMLDTFKEDLSTARKEESDAAVAFAKTKADKEESIASMTKFKEDKMVLQGDTKAELEQDKANLATTEGQLSADQEFLMKMKEDCKDFGEEFAARNTERATELEAVRTALEFLNSDDAHDLFTRTFNFLQVKKVDSLSSGQKKAIAALQKVPKTTALVQDIKLARFDKIFAAIDKMVGDLKTTMSDDVTARDGCINDLNGLDASITETARDKKDLEAKQANLINNIETLNKEVDDLKTLISEAKDAIKVAGENRTAENAEFQITVKDQTDSINLLTKALEVLRAVYQEKMNLLQQPEKQEFESYKKSSGGTSVLMLIGKIIKDAQQAKALAIQAENTAQKQYEEMVKETNGSIEMYKESKTEKKTERAAKKEALFNTEEDLDATTAELGDLTDRRAGRATDCQFLMNNFDARQEHMAKEIEALNSAKAFLNGMVAP